MPCVTFVGPDGAGPVGGRPVGDVRRVEPRPLESYLIEITSRHWCWPRAIRRPVARSDGAAARPASTCAARSVAAELERRRHRPGTPLRRTIAGAWRAPPECAPPWRLDARVQKPLLPLRDRQRTLVEASHDVGVGRPSGKAQSVPLLGMSALTAMGGMMTGGSIGGMMPMGGWGLLLMVVIVALVIGLLVAVLGSVDRT